MFITNNIYGQFVHPSPALAYVYAQNSTGIPIPNSGNTNITGWTITTDATNSFNASTGVFTAPRTGYYTVSCRIVFTNATWEIGNYARIIANTTGGTYEVASNVIQTTTSIFLPVNGSMTIRMNAGETLQIQGQQNSSSSKSLTTTATD